MWGFNKKAEVQLPELSILSENVIEETRFTPDIAKLEQSEFQRVFIYNEMQAGHRSHSFLPSALCKCDAFCYSDSYFTLWKKRLGQASQAIAFEGDGPWHRPQWDPAIRARIQGQLYVVRSSHIPVLDTYQQNGIQFRRQRVKIVRPYRSTVRAKDGYPLNGQQLDNLKARGVVHTMRGCNVLEAWMYVGLHDYWEEQLARAFAPTKVFTSPNEPWLHEYYSFTVLEYAT